MARRNIQPGKPKMIPGTIQLGIVAYWNVPVQFMLNLAEICLWPSNDIIGISYGSNARHEAARNEVISGFLKTPAEWLLWIDTDATFRYDTPHRLRQAAKEAGAEMAHPFSANYRRADNSVSIGAWTDDLQQITDYEAGARIRVGGVGCHFFLINRTVFDRVHYPWHESYMGENDLHDGPIAHDLAFCRRAGGNILWCTDIKTGHLKTWEITEDTYWQFRGAYDSQRKEA